jgi:hypothetical protein
MSEPDPWPEHDADADHRDDKLYDTYPCNIPEHTDHLTQEEARTCNILGLILNRSNSFAIFNGSMAIGNDPRFHAQSDTSQLPLSQEPTISFEERAARVPRSLEAMLKEEN